MNLFTNLVGNHFTANYVVLMKFIEFIHSSNVLIRSYSAQHSTDYKMHNSFSLLNVKLRKAAQGSKLGFKLTPVASNVL